MSNGSEEKPPTQLVPQDAALQETAQEPPETAQVWAFKQLLNLEQQRVASNNRRMEVAEKVIAAGEAAEKRQHEFHIERLRLGSSDRNDRHRSFMMLVWAAATVTVMFGGTAFYMLFFGEEIQRETAQDLLTVLGTAVGGGGALYGIRAMVQYLLERNTPEDEGP